VVRLFSSIALTAAVACVPLIANAQVPSNAFRLSNAANVPLNFSYACQGTSTLTAVTLAAGAIKSFWYNNGCTTYTIKESTAAGAEQTTFTYTLRAGHGYKIAWDASKKAWNIFLNDDPSQNAFSLRNAADKPLHFSYGCSGDTTLTPQVLEANTTRRYWYKNGCDEYTIKKSTTSGASETTFTYHLVAGGSYKIDWDPNKNAWNVFKL
jgi:hypothetical protein